MSELHVSRNGANFGPYAETQLDVMFAQGNIEPNDLVWKEGMVGWLPASEVFDSKVWGPQRVAPPPVPRQSAPPPLAVAQPMPIAAVFQPQPSQYPQISAGDVAFLPPKLHWGLVLLFSVLTLGIFLIVWLFIQSSWIRKIDSTSNATNQLIGYVVLMFVGQILSTSASSSLQGLGGLMIIGGYVVFCFGVFSMRKSMLTYFNQTEPIQLKLSAAMTFFFNIFYFQSHMTRIAKWKSTGSHEPQ